MTMLATLLSTGAVLPAAAPKAPVLDSREHRLVEGSAGVGFNRSVDTGLPTQMVGFAWTGSAQGAVEVRVREGTGSRTWTRVEGDPLEGPDLDSPEYRGRTSAGPIWLGRDARKVEVRVVEGNLEGLTVHAIRSESPPPAGGITPGGSIPAQPGIISRGAWGADESFRSYAPGCTAQPEYAPNVRFAIVHHTETSNDYGPGDSAAILRGVYYFHTHTNMWCDVGYNFLVDRYGQVFEGRAGGTDRAVVGAHAQGFNTGGTGVSIIGSFINQPVPEAAFQSTRALLAWKLALHGVNPETLVSAGGRTIPTISGHRDVNATDCPGGVGYSQLPRLRMTVGASLGALRIPSARNGKVLDLDRGSTADGARIIVWSSHGGQNQQFALQPLGDGAYRITSVYSGKVLDLAGGSTADGAPIVQWPWHGGLNQRWAVVAVGDGTYAIVSFFSGKVLDVAGGSLADGAQVVQWPWHGGANQQWRLEVV